MYNHNLIEKKWKKIWKENKNHYFNDDTSKPKYYALDMFPYPSGAGLHVGHVKSYTPTDVYSRYKRYLGYSVLHPIGWDAFGLPAEQYALKTGNHPGEFTHKNISNFKKQIEELGFSFDSNKEIDTTDPDFYKWTQWIFVQLYKNGLAEIKDIDVNWCQELGTVLANEEVLTDAKGNKISERGGFPVVKKPMKQWVLKITKYAERLINDLDELEWTEGLKNIQKKWIGKSIGANINFPIIDNPGCIQVFTSRPDTIFGVSFLGLSLDHEIVKKESLTNPDLKSFILENSNNKDFERNSNNLEKKGFLLNIKVKNPINDKIIPVFACNYVLSNYGNGAIMGVPAHDLRDYDFSKIYNLEIVKVLECDKLPFEGDSRHINSNFLNGLNNEESINKIVSFLEENKIGNKAINFKLKDWLFSRQRYWGEPFPVLFDENGQIFIDEKLPLILPKSNNISPSGDGKSPLANLKDWVNVEIGGKLYKRETNTMPQWAGSSWYYLAYILKNDEGYVDLNSNEAYKLFERWLPVDLYIGGQEHAVLHLLYARFWHKFLYDIKIVPTKEPFNRIINQGMILGSDGEKMSKSKGNVINPSDIVESHGADSLRLYMMFMGPITASLPWDDNGIDGMNKWVNRVYRLFSTKKITNNIDKKLEKTYNKFILKATNMMENFEFNMVISEMMIFINECYKSEELYIEFMKGFLVVFSCFAPFVSEEINEQFLKNNYSIFNSTWPKYDIEKTKEDKIKIPIQISGKTRDVIEVDLDLEESKIMKIVLSLESIKKWILDKNIVKTIYVKNKILNLIIK